MARSEVTVKLNRSGVRELMRSREILDDLADRAEAIARAAGQGFEVERWTGKNRARATVRTATTDARRAEATSRSLTRAIDAGR